MKPFSHKIIMTVLAFVLAGGGSYGGYTVMKDYQKYGADFENRLHVVEEVSDGDTLVIENGIRIRLLGIDAQEKDECFGEEAKAELTRLVLGKEIILEKDKTAVDMYGRLLRYVTLHNENPESDDVFINTELVRNGYAKNDSVKPDVKYMTQLQDAQSEAESENLGMWGECDPVGIKASANQERGTVSFDDECVIKGNISKKGEKDYFLPGCPNYKRVKIDMRKGEQWFCLEEEAKASGWKKSEACNNLPNI
ncbi:thermonuclease family protein [Patescibacteria group bacterium]